MPTTLLYSSAEVVYCPSLFLQKRPKASTWRARSFPIGITIASLLTSSHPWELRLLNYLFIYAPGHEQVKKEFNVSTTVALLPLSAYSLGLAFGPMISSPFSESFGRKLVYLVTLPLYNIFMLGAGFSQNIASLFICRFWRLYSLLGVFQLLLRRYLISLIPIKGSFH